MSNRHLSRTLAMQTLYEWDFNHRSQKLQDLISENIKDYAGGMEDINFVDKLVRGVTKNLPQIDKVIEKYATEWPVDKITIIDRSILRIGIYEMIFEPVKSDKSDHGPGKEVPPKVIINECIEMAKTFGGESSGKFVNGVLGAVYNDLEGKTEDKKIEEISVGGIVYKSNKGQIQFALIKDAINKWTFPKGKIGDKVEDEAIKQALSRELEEEIGIKDIKILKPVGEIDVVVNPPKKEPYNKKIFYYLVETRDKDLKSENSETVKEVKWFNQDEVLDILDYENIKEVFEQAVENINK